VVEYIWQTVPRRSDKKIYGGVSYDKERLPLVGAAGGIRDHRGRERGGVITDREAWGCEIREKAHLLSEGLPA